MESGWIMMLLLLMLPLLLLLLLPIVCPFLHSVGILWRV